MRTRTSKLAISLSIAALSVLGLAAYAIGVTGEDPGPVAADGPLLGWQPQGSLSGDGELVAAAERVWRKTSPTGGPQGDSRVLFAGVSAEGGYGPSGGQGPDGVVVLLQGHDREGGASLAYLTDIDWWSGPVRPSGPLRLIAEQPLAEAEAVRAVGSVVSGPGNHAALAIGLAEPGARVEGFTSADWHSYSSSERRSAFEIEVVPEVATPEHTVLTAKRGDDVIHDRAMVPNSFLGG